MFWRTITNSWSFGEFRTKFAESSDGPDMTSQDSAKSCSKFLTAVNPDALSANFVRISYEFRRISAKCLLAQERFRPISAKRAGPRASSCHFGEFRSKFGRVQKQFGRISVEFRRTSAHAFEFRRVSANSVEFRRNPMPAPADMDTIRRISANFGEFRSN